MNWPEATVVCSGMWAFVVLAMYFNWFPKKKSKGGKYDERV